MTDRDTAPTTGETPPAASEPPHRPRPWGGDRTIFTSADIRKYTGISRSKLNRWVQEEVVTPRNARAGHGNRAVFSFCDQFAVMAGLHYESLGFDDGWVKAAVRLLADLGSAVIDECKAGRSWLAPGRFIVTDGKRVYVPGRMVPPPAPENLLPDQAELVRRLDIRKILDRLSDGVYAAEVEKKRTRRTARKSKKRAATTAKK